MYKRQSAGWKIDLRGDNFAPALIFLLSILEGYGFCFLNIFGKLRQIPEAHNELAAQSGRHLMPYVRWIVLPALRNTLITLVLLRFFISFGKFDAPWLAYARTRASAYGDTFGVWVYRQVFETGQHGVASAAVTIFVMVVGTTGFLAIRARVKR